MIKVIAYHVNPAAGSGIPQSEANGPITLFEIPSAEGDPRPFISATVSNEMGNAGSFEFTVEPKSRYYNIWLHMKTLVRVVYGDDADSNDTLFFGRVSTIDRDMFRNKKVHCEGAFTYFMDSVFEGKKNGYRIYLSEYIEKLVDAHNECMTDAPEKKIYLGEVPGHYTEVVSDIQQITSDKQKFAAATGYKSVKDWLEELVSDYGGFMRVRYEPYDECFYLDWMKVFYNPNANNQVLSVDSNAIDISDTVEVNNIFTHVIPIGKNGLYVDGTKASDDEGDTENTKHDITVTVNNKHGANGRAWADTNSAVKGLKITLTAKWGTEASNAEGTGIDLGGISSVIGSAVTSVVNRDTYFEGWTVSSGGVTIADDDTFTMPNNDVSIVANFDCGYTVTVHSVSKNGGYGHAWASPSFASAGETVNLQYRIVHIDDEPTFFEKWEVVSGNVTISAGNSFTMPSSDVEINAYFNTIDESTLYNVSFEYQKKNDSDGYATAFPSRAVEGTTVYLTKTPKTSYTYFEKWEVVSGGVTITNDSFVMPKSSVTIRAVFTADTKEEEPIGGNDE